MFRSDCRQILVGQVVGGWLEDWSGCRMDLRRDRLLDSGRDAKAVGCHLRHRGQGVCTRSRLLACRWSMAHGDGSRSIRFLDVGGFEAGAPCILLLCPSAT